MEPLNKDTLRRFLDRFYSFNDAVIRRLELHYATGHNRVAVTLSAQDQQSSQGWCNVVLVVEDVSEIAFREGKATCQVLSSGLVVTWFDENVWCDFSPDLEPETTDEFRQSDFYVVGRTLSWRAEPYSEQ
jgi:hypothetical protein